jgi:Flp pilus assembly pilin Flp
VSFYGIAGHEIGLDRGSNLVKILVAWRRLHLDRSGVTALEYGIIAAFFCIGLVAVFSGFGSTVTAMFLRATNGI